MLRDEKESTEYRRGSASPAELERYLSSIAKGNRRAMEGLYHATSAEIYGYALFVLKDTNDAQDVLQDAYLSIYKGSSTYTQKGKPIRFHSTRVKTGDHVVISIEKQTPEVSTVLPRSALQYDGAYFVWLVEEIPGPWGHEYASGKLQMLRKRR